MKKLLIIAMVGMVLTGVGCKQTKEATKDIKKSTKQIEEYQEEKPVEEEKDSDEERYIKAEEYVREVASKNDYEAGSVIVIRVDNCITIRMEADTNGYSMDGVKAYARTKEEAYELLQFDEIAEALHLFAATGQTETRRQFGDDITIVVDFCFGEDKLYSVDGDGTVMYNWFDEHYN